MDTKTRDEEHEKHKREPESARHDEGTSFCVLRCMEELFFIDEKK